MWRGRSQDEAAPSRFRAARAAEAKGQLVRLLLEITRAGTTVMELARQGRPLEPWTIYPDEHGVFDLTTRCQFYYHVHPESRHEAGHFHTVRLFDSHTVHLVGISMGASGWPQALFTVNLWAIGDAYEPPDRLQDYARRFRVAEGRAHAWLVRFVNLMFRAYLPEIEWLQEEKERAIAAYRQSHAGADPFEDRSVEILSHVAIDVPRITAGP
jgi:hypothetical protein